MTQLPALESTEQVVLFPAGEVELAGDLALPLKPRALVLFAHGRGSNRRSSRNRFVAEQLIGAGFGALLIDLLTESEQLEDKSGDLLFDVTLLAGRLVAAVDWISDGPSLECLSLGCFGSSNGAAVALAAAAERPSRIGAVVSRGGYPMLARGYLGRVAAPTLLILGGKDKAIVPSNKQAFDILRADKQLEIVPEATHLFVEPAALERVGKLTADWYQRHLQHGLKT